MGSATDIFQSVSMCFRLFKFGIFGSCSSPVRISNIQLDLQTKHQGAWDVSFWEQRLSTSQKTPWSLDSLVMVHGCWWLASDLWNIWDDLNSRHGPNCVCKKGSAADSADSASTASYGINPYGSRVSAGIHNAINIKNSLRYDCMIQQGYYKHL